MLSRAKPWSVEEGCCARSTWCGALRFGLVALAAVGCERNASIDGAGKPYAAGPPDVLLISIDTLRADHLGCYGHAAARTPVIDGLAAEGAVFEAAFTAVPITLPAHASMLSGLIPPRHGVRDNGSFRLPETVMTLAEALHDQGYQTAAFIGGLPLLRAGGLSQGFDHYDDAVASRSLAGSARANRPERYAEEVLTLALAWLRAAGRDRPAFAFIHLYDPHSPYEKSLPGESSPGYDGEVAYVDRALGQFRASLGQDDRGRPALTVITSDHGEGLGEHGEQTHCTFVYDSTLRIPLVLSWPGRISPRRIAEPAGIVDLVPTVLDLLDLPPIDGLDGVSLEGAVLRAAHGPARELYFESLFGQLRFGWAPLRGLRRAAVKFIDAPRPELYDLRLDPGELDNQYLRSAERAADFRQLLYGIGDGASARIELDPQTERALAGLGYISAPPARGANSSELPDPKDRIEAYQQFQRAHESFLEGRLQEALAIMASLEQVLRGSPYFYVEWGNFAASAKQWPLAVNCYERCLKLDGAYEDALLNLGVAQLEMGSPAQARQQFEKLLAINPDHVQAHLYDGVVLYRHFHDGAGARLHWQRFLDLAPDHPQAAEIRRVLGTLP